LENLKVTGIEVNTVAAICRKYSILEKRKKEVIGDCSHWHLKAAAKRRVFPRGVPLCQQNLMVSNVPK
jgi:hypothetical protein